MPTWWADEQIQDKRKEILATTEEIPALAPVDPRIVEEEPVDLTDVTDETMAELLKFSRPLFLKLKDCEFVIVAPLACSAFRAAFQEDFAPGGISNAANPTVQFRMTEAAKKTLCRRQPFCANVFGLDPQSYLWPRDRILQALLGDRTPEPVAIFRHERDDEEGLTQRYVDTLRFQFP